MSDTAGAPWLKYQQAGASAAAPSAGATPGPWTKYQTAPTPNPPPQEKSVSGQSDIPAANIIPDVKQEYAGGQKMAKEGAADLLNPQADLAGRLGGAIKTAWGEFQEVGAPTAGFTKAMMTDPIKKAGGPAAPYLAGAGEALMDVALPGAAGKIGKTALEAAPGIGRALSTIGKAAPEAVAPAVVNSADDMKKVASHYYQQATEQGGTLAPHYVDQIIDKIEKPLVRPEKIGKIAGEDDATSLAKSIREHAGGKPMTLEEAQALDEHMGDLVDKHFTVKGLDKVGKRIVDMQSGLRESIGSADETHLVGGAGGFEALKNGRKAWSQAAKMRDIESIVDGAQYADQPTTWVRNRIRTILTNKTKRRGFSDAEIAELEKVAKTGKVEGMLKAFGGRLTPYMAEAVGGSVGGIPGFLAGAAIGHGGSTLARNAATGLQGRKVNDLMNMLGQGAPPDSGEILRVLGQQNAP